MRAAGPEPVSAMSESQPGRHRFLGIVRPVMARRNPTLAHKHERNPQQFVSLTRTMSRTCYWVNCAARKSLCSHGWSSTKLIERRTAGPSEGQAVLDSTLSARHREVPQCPPEYSLRRHALAKLGVLGPLREIL